ncbi:MAG: rhodanese-like domain-containing protein [Sporichthyaceae bacterium]
MTTPAANAVLRFAPASPPIAAEYFGRSLTFYTDVSDVAGDLDATLAAGHPAGFVLLDSRGDAAWAAGRIPGAIHLRTVDIPARAAQALDPSVPVVVYCWGPGCNGATRAAHTLATMGYRVKEMLGGFEYWVREGFAVATDSGTGTRTADPLTTAAGPVCDC